MDDELVSQEAAKPKRRAPRQFSGRRRIVAEGIPSEVRTLRDAATGRLVGRKASAKTVAAQQAKMIREAERDGQMVPLELLPRTLERPTPLPLPLAEDRDPWERQPREAPKAYAYFVRYRDLGPFDRSISKVARVLGVGRTVPQRMFAQWRWEERAAAWDNQKQREFDDTKKDEQEKSVRSHFNASRALLGLVAKLVVDQQGKTVPDGKVLRDAALALDKAIHHNRLSLGLPTQISNQDQYLKNIIQEMTANQNQIMAILEEVLCDECRDGVRGKIVELKRRIGRAEKQIGVTA